jgi:hypothetical protein
LVRLRPSVLVALVEGPLALHDHLVVLRLNHFPDLVPVILRKVPLRVRETLNTDLLHAVLPASLNLPINLLDTLELIRLDVQQLDIVHLKQREK